MEYCWFSLTILFTFSYIPTDKHTSELPLTPVSLSFRSISAAEDVPRGSRLLDDHVLQHYTLPFHLLTYLQPFPADSWKHGVRHLIYLLFSHITLQPPNPFHLLELLYASFSMVWLILTSRLNRDLIPAWLISPDVKSQVGHRKGERWLILKDHLQHRHLFSNDHILILDTSMGENQNVVATSLNLDCIFFTAPLYLLRLQCAQQSMTPTHQACDRNPFMH